MSDSLHGVRANALFEGEGPIRVVPWPDAVADASGFAAASAMVEWCWLPVVGPSGAWAYRRLVSALAANHGAYDQDLAELAHWLGLGAGVSPCDDHRAMRRRGDGGLRASRNRRRRRRGTRRVRADGEEAPAEGGKAQHGYHDPPPDLCPAGIVEPEENLWLRDCLR